MKHVTKRATLLTIFLLFFSFVLVPTSFTHTLAQNTTDNGILAVSNWGETLDFRTYAAESAKTNNSRAFTDRLVPPRIPQSMKTTESILAPDAIIGNDDRIKLADTTYFPWSTVVKIHGSFGIYTFDCSGWMLGPSTVTTAAHCIYDYGDTNSYAKNVIVTPAMNSDSPNSEPFGYCEAVKSWIINLWETTGNAKYDYGVYAIRCRVGEQTGNLGYRVLSDAQIDGKMINVTGFPLDKGGSTMWFGLGHVLETPTDFLFYDNDSTGGQSGAPVWELIDDSCQVCVVAIHSGGDEIDYNVGVRVTNDVFDFLFTMQQWVYNPVFLPMILKSDDDWWHGEMADGDNSNPKGKTTTNPYPVPNQTDLLLKDVPYPTP
jgi:glutamyl endopeptidase